MTPHEAGILIAVLREYGYLLPVQREIPGGRVVALDDEFVVGPCIGDERVVVLHTMRMKMRGELV
jgi:hypothetical protein